MFNENLKLKHLRGLCGVSARVCDLSLSFFLISLHSGGSNVRFFYTWPCLFGRTYQRRLVGTSLPLPAFQPVWSNLVKSACRRALCYLFFLFFFVFLSFLFSCHAWHEWIVPLPSFWCSTLFFFFLSVSSIPALPLPLCFVCDLYFEAPGHNFGIPQLSSCLFTFINIWGTDTYVL